MHVYFHEPIFMSIFSHKTLLSLPALHCAPQFRAVALAILMG